MPERPRVGYRIIAEIMSVKGKCTWNHKVGDRFEISCHDTAGLCGYFFHDLFPTMQMLQYGGANPWAKDKDVLEKECADRANAVRIKLTRVRE